MFYVRLLAYMIQTTTNNKLGIEWNNIIKKEALGTDDDDLGEVQEVGSHL
jgi:hypothetical protein